MVGGRPASPSIGRCRETGWPLAHQRFGRGWGPEGPRPTQGHAEVSSRMGHPRRTRTTANSVSNDTCSSRWGRLPRGSQEDKKKRENRGTPCANTTRVHQPEASMQVCGTETCRGRLRLLPEERASHPSSSIPATANARSYSVSRLRGPTSEAGVISTRRSARPHGLNKTANVHSQWANK